MLGMVHKSAQGVVLDGGLGSPIAHGQGLGAPIAHGQGLGAPIAHGQGLGQPITPIYGFGNRRWDGYEALADCTDCGLGVSDADLEAMAVKMAADPMVMSSSIAELMKGMNKAERETFAAKLIAAGVSASTVASAKRQVAWDDFTDKPVSKFWMIASTISMAASAYHGYKRNDSVGWALWWGFMGGLFPVITPVIGVAQGFGKPKGQ